MTANEKIREVIEPCPFCGGEAQVGTIHAAGISWSQVECVERDCATTGPKPATEAEAIALWNNRAPADLCGGEVVAWHVTYSDGKVFGRKLLLSEPDPSDYTTVTPLYAKPQQPAAEGDTLLAAAARAALGTWLAWPDASRDGPVAVDNQKTESWLRGLPNVLAAASLVSAAEPAALSPRSATPEVGGEELVERVAKAIEGYERDPTTIRRFSWHNWKGHARAAIAAMPTCAAIRAETTAQVVAWISNLSGDQFPTCTAREILDVVATSIERGDHLTGGGE